jgi:hypothetical protein
MTILKIGTDSDPDVPAILYSMRRVQASVAVVADVELAFRRHALRTNGNLK